MLYTAKGAGSLLVPAATAIARVQGWDAVFIIAMSFNLLAALLALVVLKPLRARHFAALRAADPDEVAGNAVRRTGLT
jgi:OFA family oxalate/formate antiporter-like MFS transporter